MALFDELQAAAASRLRRAGTARNPANPDTIAALSNFRNSMPAIANRTIQPGTAQKSTGLQDLLQQQAGRMAGYKQSGTISKAYGPGGGSGILPPPASLANSPEVNDAYRNLMNATSQGDADKGDLRRSLTTNLEVSHRNRDKSILGSHTNLNEGGILNSGIALKKDTELNTNYDTVDRQMTDNTNKGIGDIDRSILDYSQRYQDRQVEASAAETQRRADAAAAKLAADSANADQAKQIADLMTTLGLGAGAAVAPTPEDPIWEPAPYLAPASKPAAKKPAVKKAASGSTGSLAQKKIGGPQ